MSDLIPSLESFKISNEKLIDITDDFFKITSKIDYSKIIKSNNFSLLHGTHALELLNSRLDTFLLEKTNFSIDDNTNLSIIDATSIISNQLKSLTCWLGQNISLPNSILSCEYISQILENYTKFGNFDNLNDLSNCNWNSIVLKFSILLISTTKFILELSLKSQIYEDEDLSTTTMNLDWLFGLSNNEIFKLTLVSNKTWLNLKNNLNENEVKFLELIKDSFQILQTLLSLDNLLNWEIPLFNINNSKDFLIKFDNKLLQLEKILEKLNQLDLLDLDSLTPPVNCFSLNSQIKFDNQAPPKSLKIVQSSWNDCILNLNQLFNDLIDILKIFKSENILQFLEWLKYLENKRTNLDLNEVNGLHIIARVLFYSLINNNNNNSTENNQNLVFNISGVTFKDLFWNYLKDFALNNSKLDNELKLNRNPEILQQIDYYVDTVSLFWKESILLPTLNPSRQRQFKCKELKYWNMRQSETGSLEDYFNLNFYRSKEKFYPLTFIIIYFKLKSISEFILKSIELNLFKDIREYLSVYYQLTLISFQLNQQIDNLILMTESNNNKKSLIYLNFLKNENNLIYQLSIFKSKTLELLSYLGFNELPKNLIKSSSINEELLFKLQWKQLNDINDPEMLKFNDYRDRLNDVVNDVSHNFENFENSIKEEIDQCVTEFNKSINICNSLMNNKNQLNWFDDLKNIKTLSFESLQNELMKSKNDILKLIDLIKVEKFHDGNIKEKYNLKIVLLGRHKYFPGYKLVERN